MSRNSLYVLIAILLVVVAGFAVYAFQQESEPDGVEIQIDDTGLSVEET